MAEKSGVDDVCYCGELVVGSIDQHNMNFSQSCRVPFDYRLTHSVGFLRRYWYRNLLARRER